MRELIALFMAMRKGPPEERFFFWLGIYVIFINTPWGLWLLIKHLIGA